MENKQMLDSERENVAGGVVKLILLNPKIKNPNLIYPGDVIRLSL